MRIIKHADALNKKNYDFDVILSKGNELPKIQADEVIKNRETMLNLLKDVNSVDTCFVFESDGLHPTVGLWAHCVILGRYKGFEEAIQNASKESAYALLDKSETKSDTTECLDIATMNDKGSNTLILHDPKDISLSTLAVLLRFVYTGEINLPADPGQHVISRTLAMPKTSRKFRESFLWNPMDVEVDPNWRLKDVPWEVLLQAADHYDVTEVREDCQDILIRAMSESNVMDTLFKVGSSFDTVKEAALDFIVNMSTMISNGNNPFIAYKNHPDCHSFMFEVMRRRAKKD
ncbi:hypothetical protein BGZ46_007335 [Entomortierella lignicola]|nr:hypothetical protein BGZ46_007335 [Entomortierella lignicola]